MSTALNAIVTHRIEVASGLIILRVAPKGFVEATGKQPGQVHAEKYWVFGFPSDVYQQAHRCLKMGTRKLLS